MKVLAMDMGGTFIKYGICEVSKTGSIKFFEKDRFKTPHLEGKHGTVVLEAMAQFAQQMVLKHRDIKCICTTVGGGYWWRTL